MTRSLRHRWSEFTAWVSYRADRFLEREPLLQVAALFAMAVLVIVGWALVLAHLDPAPDAPTGSEALWWALTRFLDGGTMAGDPASRRGLATLATLSGVFGVAVLTSVLTSKMGERIGVLASGEGPVVERGHILVLGFDPRVKVVAEQLARTGQKLTLVVVSTQSRKQVEDAMGTQRGVRVVVRTGDPQQDALLRSVRAHRARTVIVLRPVGRSDEDAVRWSFIALLAIRRVVEAEAEAVRPRLVVEVRDDEAERRLRRALVPRFGEGAQVGLQAEFIAPAQAIGGMLAMALRQPGLYPVLHALLSFDGVDLAFEPVRPSQFGMTWELAEASMRGAIALGLARKDERVTVDLNPPRDGTRVLREGDEFAMLRRSGDKVHFEVTQPAAVRSCNIPAAGRDPRRVLILGANASLASLLVHLPLVLLRGDQVRLVTGQPSKPRLGEGETLLAAAGIRLSVEPTNPLDVAAEATDDGARVVVILASDESRDRSCDALAVEMLVALRTHSGPGRAVADVHSTATAAYLAGEGNDFLVSSELIGMMFAQEALSPEAAQALRQLLATKADIHILTRDVGPDEFPPGTPFSALAARVRETGEIALGYQLPRHKGQPVTLAPPPGDQGWAVPGAVVVVLARLPR